MESVRRAREGRFERGVGRGGDAFRPRRRRRDTAARAQEFMDARNVVVGAFEERSRIERGEPSPFLGGRRLREMAHQQRPLPLTEVRELLLPVPFRITGHVEEIVAYL